MIVRTKRPYDSAIPSGNAVAVNNLIRLDAKYRNYAQKTLRIFAKSMKDSPSSFMYMLYALNGYLSLDENSDVSIIPELPLEEPGIGATNQTRVTATAQIKTSAKSKAINTEVRVIIPKDWHINANPTGQEFSIPTTITIAKDAPVEIVEVNYPKGKSVKFEFSTEPLNVYEGTLTIPLKLKRKSNTDLKANASITLKLNYQMCNDNECLLPQTLDIPVKLQ